MEEELVKAIEDRGYDPSTILAILAGLRSGYIFEAKETFHKPIIRVMSKEFAKKESDKVPGKVVKRSKYSCICAKCGAKIQTFKCPECLHDNYEIMAIKGELSE